MSEKDAPAPRAEEPTAAGDAASAAGARPAATPLPDPGWYPDPWSAQPLRWWDGARWTGDTAESIEVDRRAS